MGYSSEYEVYLTEKNGVQIVINNLSLSILKEMRFREVSPTEIAVSLDVPKSTIQGNITKLLRQGIVSQDTRVDDARSAVYHIAAMLLFCSDTDVEWQLYARSASVARIMKNGRCTSREDLSLYSVSLTESGLNVVQGLFNVGSALTRGEYDRRWWEIILGKVNEQSLSHGIRTEIDTKDGLTLTIESDEGDIADVPLVVVPMLGAIISHSDTLLGFNLAHDVSMKVTNDGHKVVMHIAPFIGQHYDLKMDLERSKDTFRVEEPFSIYSINGKATLFTNSTMIAVLDCLFVCDYSLAELEEASGLSKATIYAAISKLISMGAVSTRKESGSVMKYKLMADPILYITDSTHKDFDSLYKAIEDFHNGRTDYYSSVISCAMKAIGCIGIHFDKMFIRAGRNAARFGPYNYVHSYSYRCCIV